MKTTETTRTYSGKLTFTLTGWKAVALLVALASVGAYRFTRARTALEGQGREALEAWIVGELQRPLLADTTLGLAEKGQALLDVSTYSSLTGWSHRGPGTALGYWLAFI